MGSTNHLNKDSLHLQRFAYALISDLPHVQIRIKKIQEGVGNFSFSQWVSVDSGPQSNGPCFVYFLF